jgi:DNA-binding transcriptional regulator YiaG
MKKSETNSRLTKALLETADDMRRAGVLDSAAHEKITLRHIGGKADVVAKPICGDEIRSLRKRAHLSQAVFARCLNLTRVTYRNWNAEQSGRQARHLRCSMSFAARVSRRSCEVSAYVLRIENSGRVRDQPCRPAK